jgi:hypothetical protein
MDLLCQYCYKPQRKLIPLGNGKKAVADICVKCYTAIRKMYPANATVPQLFRLKFRIITLLGRQCSCCGEGRIEFLRLDQVNNIRVLCVNCFTATRNGSLCPHQRKNEPLFIE